jgi:hypothetical protein
MLVLIEQSGSDAANSMLNVYEVYGVCKNRGNLIASIWEEDFFELLPDADFEKAQKGKVMFNVLKGKLSEKSKRWYGH